VPTQIYTLSLHDALPIYHPLAIDRCNECAWIGVEFVAYASRRTPLPFAEADSNGLRVTQGEDLQRAQCGACVSHVARPISCGARSEEHTCELQSRENLVC